MVLFFVFLISQLEKHGGSEFFMNRAVTPLRSGNVIELLRACGRRRALYGDNHLARQQRGLLALVSRLFRQ